MSPRFQRLLIIIISLIFFIFAIFLILFNSKNNLIYFYTPSELIDSKTKIHQKIRIGGFVKKGSIYREEQGVVVEGNLVKKNKINAISVFAKHDENYIPASIKKELENKKYWKKKY